MRRIRCAREHLGMPRPEYYDTRVTDPGASYSPKFVPGEIDQTPVLPGPWYHATDAELKPGDILDANRSNNFDYTDAWGPRDSKVFMHNTPRVMGYGRNLYVVEPQGEGPFPWNGHGAYSDNMHGFAAPSAKVKERIEDPQDYVSQWDLFNEQNQSLKRWKGQVTPTQEFHDYYEPKKPQEANQGPFNVVSGFDHGHYVYYPEEDMPGSVEQADIDNEARFRQPPMMPSDHAQKGGEDHLRWLYDNAEGLGQQSAPWEDEAVVNIRRRLDRAFGG